MVKIQVVRILVSFLQSVSANFSFLWRREKVLKTWILRKKIIYMDKLNFLWFLFFLFSYLLSFFISLQFKRQFYYAVSKWWHFYSKLCKNTSIILLILIWCTIWKKFSQWRDFIIFFKAKINPKLSFGKIVITFDLVSYYIRVFQHIKV